MFLRNKDIIPLYIQKFNKLKMFSRFFMLVTTTQTNATFRHEINEMWFLKKGEKGQYKLIISYYWSMIYGLIRLLCNLHVHESWWRGRMHLYNRLSSLVFYTLNHMSMGHQTLYLIGPLIYFLTLPFLFNWFAIFIPR